MVDLIHQHLGEKWREYEYCGVDVADQLRLTLKHVLDENGTFYDVLVRVELFIIGSNEKDHFEVDRKGN